MHYYNTTGDPIDPTGDPIERSLVDKSSEYMITKQWEPIDRPGDPIERPIQIQNY